MNYFLKNSTLVLLVIFFHCSLQAQFEKISIRNTSIEFEKDLIEDTANQYVKIMLCGDIMHRKDLLNKYAIDNNKYSYRSWFRQIKPLFFNPDFVVGSLRAFFPGRDMMNRYQNSAPDEFLGELSYTGFNLMLMANSSALTDRETINNKSLKKLDYYQIQRAGYYKDSIEKAETYPLVLEKKDIRIGFLNYSLDSLLLGLNENKVNFFQMDSVRKDIMKARKIMLADYIIAYIDWNGQDSLKLGKVAELLNAGIDIIIGTGSGEAFTQADLLSYSDGSLKLHVDNIGNFNALSNERNRDKSAVIEVVIKKNKATQKVQLHDMGFIPLWTLIDNERYAVLPISNIEEKHIQNINLNFVQYSTMKVALTDLRYAFFDKIPELHYDYNDRIVEAVEQTAFIRRTLMKEQDKINNEIKKKAEEEYFSLFETSPPSPGTGKIPYEDILGMYPAKKSNRIIIENEKTGKLEAYYKHDSVIFTERSLQKDIDSLEILREYISIPDLNLLEKKLDVKSELKDQILSLPSLKNDSVIVNVLLESLQEDDVEELEKIRPDFKEASDKSLISLYESRLTRLQEILSKETIQEYNIKMIQDKIDTLKNKKKYYNQLTSKEPKINVKGKQIDDKTAKISSSEFQKETTEVFGSADYITDNGTIHIKANNKHYQREKLRPLTAEEKRIADSIRQYNERFIIVDSIAEIKAKLKKQKKDEFRKRDSMFKASLDPNFRSSYNPPIEPRTAASPYRPVIRQGVYTSTTATEDNLPVKNIEEYFCVQVFTFSKNQMLDIEKYPFLIGYEIQKEDAFYRYYIGRTNSPNLAIELCKSIRSKGIEDATVIKFTNGVRTVYKDKF